MKYLNYLDMLPPDIINIIKNYECVLLFNDVINQLNKVKIYWIWNTLYKEYTIAIEINT